jgi:hypothetical protein
MKSTFYLALLCFIFLSFGDVNAQHQDINERPEMYKGKQTNALDTNSILGAFKRGHVQGHFRYFFMNTINEGELTDYYANAAGGGLRFETAKFHNFQFAISGFYIFTSISNTTISNIP